MYTHKKLFLTALLIAASLNSAQANLLKFNWSGQINYSDNSLSGVSVGDRINGTLFYESTTPNSYPPYLISNAHYAFDSSSQFNGFVSGHKIISNSLVINVTDNFGGNVEDYVSINGGTPFSVDGTAYSSGHFGITLGSKHGNTGVIINKSLPLSYDLSKFDADGFNYGSLRRDGSSTGGILGFTVTSIAPVPESSTLSFMLAGLGVIGVFLRSHKTALGRFDRLKRQPS